MAGYRKRKAEPLVVREAPASEVKNGWHGYLERVSRGREEIVITRYGKPVARLSPVEGQGEGERFFGGLAGTVTVRGDIVGPTGDRWEADG